MTPNVFTLPIPHSHFPPSFPSIISVKTFLISVLWNLYGHAHSVSASARATALLGNFQEVGYLEKRCYGVIYLFFPYSSIFQVLRMAWISSFLFFFPWKIRWQLLFWNSLIKEKEKKSSCFKLFEAKLTKIPQVFLFYLNVPFSFIWQEDWKRVLSFDLALDFGGNDICSDWCLEEFQTTESPHVSTGLQCHRHI